MTWTNGRMELADGRVLHTLQRPDGSWHAVVGARLVASCSSEQQAQAAAEAAAGVTDAPQTPDAGVDADAALDASVDAPPRSPPLFCLNRPTVRCGEAWKDKATPCGSAGYECMSDSDTMRYEKNDAAAQPSERAMGFAEGVEAAFLDDDEVVRLRAEVKKLEEYADLYVQAHDALDEAREQVAKLTAELAAAVKRAEEAEAKLARVREALAGVEWNSSPALIDMALTAARKAAE
jgi:hypothetical protein